VKTKTTVKRLPDIDHGFFGMTGLPANVRGQAHP
jgi:hypothetical protein